VQGRELPQAIGQDSYVLAAQQREEHGQKQRATCSTRSELARARPRAPPRAPRRAKQPADAMARAHAYKAPQASITLFRARSNLTGAKLAVGCPGVTCPRPPEPLPP
jgi:phage protein D